LQEPGEFCFAFPSPSLKQLSGLRNIGKKLVFCFRSLLFRLLKELSAVCLDKQPVEGLSRDTKARRSRRLSRIEFKNRAKEEDAGRNYFSTSCLPLSSLQVFLEQSLLLD
jgi:hypothetical protein